jgi:putative transposase
MREGDSFGGKLHHEPPGWVGPGAIFHIRIRCAVDNPVALTQPELAAAILASARLYHEAGRWHALVMLLMPDHLHALLSFAIGQDMSRVLGDWKRFQAARHGVRWQSNYFDHRVRDDEQLRLKHFYILNNPVAKGLCEKPEDWPWKF